MRNSSISYGFGFVIALLAIIVYNEYRTVAVERIQYDVAVGNNTEFKLDKNMIHFGAMKRGDRAYRTIVLDASENYSIRAINNGPDFVYPEERKLKVSAGEEKKLKVYAQIPQNADEKIYKGEILLIFKSY